MSNISFYIKSIKTHITKKHIITPELNYILGIKIVDSNTKQIDLSPSYIYIGDGGDIENIAKEYLGKPPITLFSAGTTESLDVLPKKENLNLIITDYNLSSLYNHINSILMNYNNWDYMLTNAVCKEKGLDYLLKISSKFLDAHIILFNSGYHVVGKYLTESFSSKYAAEVKSQDFLCYNTVINFEKYMDTSAMYTNDIHHFIPDFENNHIYVKRIYHNALITSTLMFIVNESHSDYDIPHMVNHMAGIIKSLTVQSTAELISSSSRLGSLISDIHSRENIGSFEINDRLNNLTYKLKKYIRCIVINFYNSEIDVDYDDILRKVSFIFSGCNVAIYKKTIIVLYSTEEKTYQIPDVLYNPDFNELLEKYNALAVVSNSVHRYSKFRSLYYLCRRLSKILRALTFYNPYGRVFPYDEYSMYVSIDFAARQFQTMLGSVDIILLADPAIITLHRYDNEHKTNLCAVLLNYLTNGRNITLTAKSMYMHRNTVQNKISKINNLISLDLSDGNIQQRLLYSCQVVKYYEEYIKEKLT